MAYSALLMATCLVSLFNQSSEGIGYFSHQIECFNDSDRNVNYLPESVMDAKIRSLPEIIRIQMHSGFISLIKF